MALLFSIRAASALIQFCPTMVLGSSAIVVATAALQPYQNTLNHSSVTPSADLDDLVSEDVPMLHEVTRTIRRLKNGRAAGADGITAELLKGAEKPRCNQRSFA